MFRTIKGLQLILNEKRDLNMLLLVELEDVLLNGSVIAVRELADQYHEGRLNFESMAAAGLLASIICCMTS